MTPWYKFFKMAHSIKITEFVCNDLKFLTATWKNIQLETCTLIFAVTEKRSTDGRNYAAADDRAANKRLVSYQWLFLFFAFKLAIFRLYDWASASMRFISVSVHSNIDHSAYWRFAELSISKLHELVDKSCDGWDNRPPKTLHLKHHVPAPEEYLKKKIPNSYIDGQIGSIKNKLLTLIIRV